MSRQSTAAPTGFGHFHVVVHVEIRALQTARNRSNWHTQPANRVKTAQNDLHGRNRSEFGTVRPRVQIPGPRPNFECSSRQADVLRFSRLARWASLNDGRTTALTLC